MVDITLQRSKLSLPRFRNLHIREQLLQVVIISLIAFSVSLFAIWGLYRTGALLEELRTSIQPERDALQLAKELEHIWGLFEAYQLSFNQPEQRQAISEEIKESKKKLAQYQTQFASRKETLPAVRMAIEMRDRALRLIDKWHRCDHELGFGKGIDQGYASLGTIGFEGRYDYAAIGAVVNRAARLCAAAANGEILVSQRVLGDVSTEIEFEAIGKLKLKGLGLTSTFNVTKPRPGVAADTTTLAVVTSDQRD